ncbi:hypothetical protein MCBG_02210 [Micromonospora sp. M42]|nr:hypothetical protein MCBG_02210 [Micromonospora sp. M42]
MVLGHYLRDGAGPACDLTGAEPIRPAQPVRPDRRDHDEALCRRPARRLRLRPRRFRHQIPLRDADRSQAGRRSSAAGGYPLLGYHLAHHEKAAAAAPLVTDARGLFRPTSR